MIDINKIVLLGKEQFNRAVNRNPSEDKEKIFEEIYTTLLDNFLELLVSEFFKGFKENVNTFTEILGKEFESNVPSAKILAKEITDEYVLTKENFEVNLSKLRFLQKDKNNFLDFMNGMQRDLTENKIEQFLVFYTSTSQDASIKTCSKITDWIEMIGMIEVMKTRIMGQYQSNMMETK